MIGIYKITNLVNGHSYIGQSINIDKRWNKEKSCAFNCNDKSYNYPLSKAFRKYGIENFSFEILEECNKEKLNEREIYYISLYNTYYNGYNQTKGGQNCPYSKLKENQVLEIKQKLITQKYSLEKLSKEYNVHKDTIRNINNGDIWSYIGIYNKYPLYISKKNKNYQKEKTYCKDCGQEIDKKSTYCLKCVDKHKKQKGNYPDVEKIYNDICNLGFVGAGKLYGVSDNALRKHCKKIGLPSKASEYKISYKRKGTEINQFDKNGNFLKSFNTITSAAEWIKQNGYSITDIKIIAKNIGNNIKGNSKTSYGFIWKLK